MVFAQLKEVGLQCEFVTEQARLYIAKKRFSESLHPEDKLVLTDEDQIKIMKQQMEIEFLMSRVIGEDQLLITDSSPLNSLLYMTDDLRKTPEVQDLAIKAACQTDIAFYAPPVTNTNYQIDPNRVHTIQQSLLIDKTIANIMRECGVWENMIQLVGEPQQRLSQATKVIIGKKLTG